MEHPQPNQLALFIDGENTKPDFEQLLSFCSSYGEIRLARIYGNRDLLRIPRWQKACQQFHFEPVYSEKGQKNSADMLLVVDAVETLYRYPEITTYVIASVDSDFLPLVHRLRKHKKQTIGISTSYPPALLRGAFHAYHTLLRPEWDVFEFCAQQFYLAYLDCQVYDGWALADEIFFSLPDPVPFLQRLHQMGFDSFFSFLKNCRMFSIHKEKMHLPKSQIVSYWIRNPFELFSEPAMENIRPRLQQYSQDYYIQNQRHVSTGIPGLLRQFASAPPAQTLDS